MQGVVYELLNERSEPMSLVLKAIPHGKVSAVTGVLPSMEREWAVGHRLALYCTSASGGARAACAKKMRADAVPDMGRGASDAAWTFCVLLYSSCMRYEELTVVSRACYSVPCVNFLRCMQTFTPDS